MFPGEPVRNGELSTSHTSSLNLLLMRGRTTDNPHFSNEEDLAQEERCCPKSHS